MSRNSPPHSLRISRRTLLHTLSVSGLGAALGGRFPVYARQAAPKTDTRTLPSLNRFPRMVQEFFVRRENEIHQDRLKRLAALSTRSDAEAYIQAVRQKIRESFGPDPEKTPLNPRVTKVVERDVYKIENVLFESRPGFLVSANLYIPKSRRFPLPGVISSGQPITATPRRTGKPCTAGSTAAPASRTRAQNRNS